MGFGDEVMLTSFAKGAAKRGRLMAFGDGNRLIFGGNFLQVFQNNPNIVRSLPKSNIEWSLYYKGRRPTFTKVEATRYIWNYKYKVTPGEFFFDDNEKKLGEYRGGILIEPNVQWGMKSWAPNKDWGFEKYQAVCDHLLANGHVVWQTSYGPKRLKGAKVVNVSSFRTMAATLSSFDLIVCPEGGMSHAAGAVGASAVVIFGGFPAVEVVGYDFHKNFNGGAEGCGSIKICQHCSDAMKRITVEEIIEATEKMYAAKIRR